MSRSDLKIVLSYRRADEPGMAGRIDDWLTRHYGDDNVFVFGNIDSSPPGFDSRTHIGKALDQCDILIAIIGPHWLGERQRIHNETDFVRLEVETALRREIPVIPVLVEGATMPEPDQLPDTLRDLAFREAVDVESGRSFRVDVERLIRSLDRLSADAQKAEQEPLSREEAVRQEQFRRAQRAARQKAEQERLAREEAARQKPEQERPASPPQNKRRLHWAAAGLGLPALVAGGIYLTVQRQEAARQELLVREQEAARQELLVREQEAARQELLRRAQDQFRRVQVRRAQEQFRRAQEAARQEQARP